MFIEIYGAGFINKGAELMLHAIINKITERMPEAKLVMAPYIKEAPFEKRSKLGLYQKIWLQYMNIQWGYMGNVIPHILRQLLGMVLDKEISVVLDTSGFAYSDQWGDNNCFIMARAIKKWKKQGTKVILMPQAYGPFSGRRIKEAFKTIVDHADLIFARDKISYQHVIDVAGDSNNVKIAPDFTNLIKGKLPAEFDSEANRFCIIPNHRMIEMTKNTEGKLYLSFLVTCAKYLKRNGKKPFILIHEGDKDLLLGQQVAKEINADLNIILETDPLCIKGIIGASEGVISSRFHGLVSALSQGVPALATGWSHKYEMLFEDYGFPEGMLSVNAGIEDIHGAIDLITSDIRGQMIRNKILDAARLQREASSKMWDEILEVIEK